MRVHAVGSGSVVLKENFYRVADFGAENGAENSGGRPFSGSWLQLAEGLICVLPIDGFAIHSADAMRAFLNEDLGVALELHAHHLVHTARRVVPVNFVSSDKIASDF